MAFSSSTLSDYRGVSSPMRTIRSVGFSDILHLQQQLRLSHCLSDTIFHFGWSDKLFICMFLSKIFPNRRYHWFKQTGEMWQSWPLSHRNSLHWFIRLLLGFHFQLISCTFFWLHLILDFWAWIFIKSWKAQIFHWDPTLQIIWGSSLYRLFSFWSLLYTKFRWWLDRNLNKSLKMSHTDRGWLLWVKDTHNTQTILRSRNI